MATIQNIIATCYTTRRLDLKKLAQCCPNIEYNDQKFTAAIMRIRKPKSTSLIFESGRLVILGTKNEDDALKASRRHCRISRPRFARSQPSLDLGPRTLYLSPNTVYF
jgi:transcription initiation factor TFIID TATA-box-binding protein